MVSIAKAHSAFTSHSIAAWEQVVSDVTGQPRDHLTRGLAQSLQGHFADSSIFGLTHSVGKFSDSTPVRSHSSRPHDKHSLQYLYWNRLSTINFLKK